MYGSTDQYDRPFRDVGPDPWSRETWQILKDEIATHDLTEGAGIEYINVLLVGEVGMVKDKSYDLPILKSKFISLRFFYDGRIYVITLNKLIKLGVCKVQGNTLVTLVFARCREKLILQ